MLRRWAEGDALSLAVMRVTVGLVLLAMPELREVDSPLTPVLVLAAVAGVLGVLPRLAFGVATLAALVVLGIPQQGQPTTHYHHVVWLCAVLATAPSADVLSVRAPTLTGPRSVAHGLPVRVGQLLLGCVYFFPGLHKLLAQGLLWDPTSHLYWKWAQSPDLVPWFEPGPLALQVGGALVVIFELGFLPAMLVPALRPVAGVAGLVFHALTAGLFGIQFVSLWACYFILVRWSDGEPVEMSSRRGAPTLVLGVPLLLAVAAAGLRGQTQGWPIACYPTFAEPAPRAMPGLAVAWIDEGGGEHGVPMSRWPPAHPRGDGSDDQRLWREVWGASGVGGPVRPEALEALWARIAADQGLQDAAGVRFYRSTRLVGPAPRWVRGPLLHEFRPEP